MENKNWKLLQLFAEGGDGGAEGAGQTGESAAAAGQQVREAESASINTQRAEENGQAAAANPRLTWEQIKADPEYRAQMQAMVQSRLKNVKQAQEDLAALTPALQLLARENGLDAEKLDYGALAQAIARKQTQGQMDAYHREQALQQHYSSLQRQAQQLQQKYPGFDLNRELQNPTFFRMTVPGTGVSLEDAYFTVHRREITRAAMAINDRKTAARISGAIRSGILRPQENGTSASAPSVAAFDYRTASREQRDALKNKIRQAVARGEKVYPGTF